MKKKENRIEITKLVAASLVEAHRLEYKPSTLDAFERYWGRFEHFARRKRHRFYSVELLESFLTQEAERIRIARPKATSVRVLKTSVRYLHEVALSGSFSFRRPKSQDCLDSLPKAIVAQLKDYAQHRAEFQYLSFSGSYRCARELERFARFAVDHGVEDFAIMQKTMIADYLQSRILNRPKTLQSATSFLRCFFRHLAKIKVVGDDYAEAVPTIRMWQQQRIPDVWSPEDVKRLLDVVDRRSPMGKRDYAILLLAARLGMRSADIRRLKLENLDWKGAQIVFTQSKSGKALELPMPEDVGAALIEYLRHSRPPSKYREVFLRHFAPFAPFGPQNNLFSIITLYRRKAGIKLPREKHRGLHSLRHTLATRLLNGGVALETISAVLGHASPDTTRIYAKASVETLRSVAMTVKEVSHV